MRRGHQLPSDSRHAPQPGRVERVQTRRERASGEPKGVVPPVTRTKPRSAHCGRLPRRAERCGAPVSLPCRQSSGRRTRSTMRPFQEERPAGEAAGRCARSRRRTIIARWLPSYNTLSGPRVTIVVRPRAASPFTALADPELSVTRRSTADARGFALDRPPGRGRHRRRGRRPRRPPRPCARPARGDRRAALLRPEQPALARRLLADPRRRPGRARGKPRPIGRPPLRRQALCPPAHLGDPRPRGRPLARHARARRRRPCQLPAPGHARRHRPGLARGGLGGPSRHDGRASSGAPPRRPDDAVRASASSTASRATTRRCSRCSSSS